MSKSNQIPQTDGAVPEASAREQTQPAEDRVSDSAAFADESLTDSRWWLRMAIQPLLMLACIAVGVAGLGVAQKMGWISAGGDGHQHAARSTEADVDYICPMMCTPPQKEPGRCPVCAMELVKASAGSGGDGISVSVDPASRRVANIQTAYVKSVPLMRNIRTVGRLAYDEGTLTTIAAWAPGRLEKLYADYTGVVVSRNDHLALVYSPELYSGQVELLVAKNARMNAARNPSRLTLVDGDLYDSARERLIELGMTEDQIREIEEKGEANSRMHLCAPSSGTVIEKMATEGEYVKTGQPIYRLADLSNVWLMLELFPEDAAAIRYGQKVESEVHSLPGRKFAGRVAFINPHVDEATRTVGVRVVIENPNGILRIGDFATASISVPVVSHDVADSDFLPLIYDAELADKWISPRHPHIIRDKSGQCPVCTVELVPASEFGFASVPQISTEVLTVPRNAVLMAGRHSVLYVETDPGRFEIRTVTLGPGIGDDIVIMDGITAKEKVATSGNFLIDSQMQLAGNPSLIDPSRALPLSKDALTPEALEAIAQLSEADRELAATQKVCPVAGFALGSMGIPVRAEVNGEVVFLCCEGCRDGLMAEPDRYLALLQEAKTNPDILKISPEMELPEIGEITFPAPELPQIGNITEFESSREPANEFLPSVPMPKGFGVGSQAEAIRQALETLSKEDAAYARRQQICPVAEMKLGSMGPPIKVNVEGTQVFICCESCREELLTNPDKYLARLPKETAK